MRLEFDRWPVVVVTFGDEIGAADMAALVGVVQSALERRRPFGLVIVSGARPQSLTAAASQLTGWIERHRPQLRVWCRGVAYAACDGAQRDADARRLAPDPGVWGCPTQATADLEDGLRWIGTRLA